MSGKKELAIFIALSCALQVVIGAPMLIARLTNRTLPQAPPFVRVWGSRVAIVALWILGLIGTATRY